MAVPAASTLIKTEDTSKSQLTIKVTGFQWGWNYEYLNNGVMLLLAPGSRQRRGPPAGSRAIDANTVPHYLLNVDHPLVVPVGTKVRLLITGADVIHSWWVPAFGVKKDAIPGFVNEAWFNIDADKPGLYRGHCAELCGRDHGFMPIVVDARSKEDFAAWLKAANRRAEAGRRTGRRRTGRRQPRPSAAPAGTHRFLDNRHPQQIREPPWPKTCTRCSARRTRSQAAWLAALGVRDQSQGHRHDVPGVRLHHLLHRRQPWPCSSASSCSSPGMQFFDPQFFNSMTTMHALVMIFGAVMPAWTGLANWMIPMQVGAPDMALPRLNNFSFWILPFAFTLLLSTLFVPGGAPGGRLDHVSAADAAERRVLPDD